jgi:hydroxymethylpyrimidine/phosphomethylpyrimidine kinase
MLASYPITAIKTGMLYSKSHIVAICELLENVDVPIIVDPVMVASTGDPLLVDDALEAISSRLMPLATVMTPNLPEAGILLGREVANSADQKSAAQELSSKYGAACYLKGGHLEDHNQHRDILVHEGDFQSFVADHIDLPQTHGTGCTLAAALTSGLARGGGLAEAARKAHRFTHQALKNSARWTIPSKKAFIYHLNQGQYS